MGNIAFNSFPRNMSDEDFTKALKEICNDRFGDKVEVEEKYFNGELCSWVVSPSKQISCKDDWRYEWEIYRKSKRKFGGKHPHSEWGSWLMTVIQNELAFRFNGRISDEGVDGAWKGKPGKYRTFLEYFKTINKFTFKNNPEFFWEFFEYTPETLRNITE